MPVNFDLAPPVKTVDGLIAVPIDIQTIDAALTFDGAASTGRGDATIEFITGPSDGNPIFDLRQTITAAWLDGISIPVARLAHHEFGGEADARLRVVESVLPAGSTHTLRVTYTLGTPQAPAAGNYQPAMTWSAGPRLAFNFGFTDLGPGRYLEAWVPANLIYDQFALTLRLRILNTAIPHTVITNGTATSIAANHWSIAFPPRFTALSTLVELRATDTLEVLTDTTTLPISGKTVTIEAWKLITATAVDLGTAINRIKTLLADNENSTGPYIHDNRFVAFLHQGGMEYDGGTTADPAALQHETFHSWWARGVKPASQGDAWWDEAWTRYNDFGAIAAPFNFSVNTPVLCPRNPWIRTTAPGAYHEGAIFFSGVASLVGVANLKSLMSIFYNERKERPATTAQLEEFLVARSGNAQLVDGFHHWVYGLRAPSPAPDLWLRDDAGHGGNDAWNGNFWDSPDVWIRRQDDGGTTHESPEFGKDNWFYARVQNRSATATARHFLVTFNVRTFAGTQFVYPDDFLPCLAAAVGFELGPGSSTIIKARWPAAYVPPAGTHTSCLAAVLARLDHPVAGRHVWEHNNLAQKNISVVDLAAGDSLILPFVLRTELSGTLIEIVRPESRPRLDVALLHRSRQLFAHGRVAPFKVPLDDTFHIKTDCGAGEITVDLPQDRIPASRPAVPRSADDFAESFAAPFEAGHIARIPVSLQAGDQRVLGLYVRVPKDAEPGEVIRMNLVQRDAMGKQVVGGIAVEVHVVNAVAPL